MQQGYLLRLTGKLNWNAALSCATMTVTERMQAQSISMSAHIVMSSFLGVFFFALLAAVGLFFCASMKRPQPHPPRSRGIAERPALSVALVVAAVMGERGPPGPRRAAGQVSEVVGSDRGHCVWHGDCHPVDDHECTNMIIVASRLAVHSGWYASNPMF
mmetsp:Transcript_116587/g.293247  ORF Transcript_116587/g.293247 Transcript_116587/m.293247 type:complete len:159 (-) Transcript_116587:138-614(-)